LKSQSGPEDEPNDSKVHWLLCKGAKTPEKGELPGKVHIQTQSKKKYNKGKIVADKKKE
jgi:hypothetical protein